MKILIQIIFVFVLLLQLLINVWAQESGTVIQSVRPEKFRAKILEINEIECESTEQKDCKEYLLEITDGPSQGIPIKANIDSTSFSAVNYEVGNDVFVEKMTILDHSMYSIIGPVREMPILFLAVIFIGLTLIIGRKQGFGSLIGLGFSIFTLFGIIVPLIIQGHNAVFVGFLGACFVLLVSIYLSHGFNRKTTIAFFSTLFGLFVSFFLAGIFISLSKLSGFGEEEAYFVMADFNSNIDMSGILLVSILVGGIGIIDDVAVNQVSSTFEIYQANPSLNQIQLFKSAMNIGKDHIASMVNTLFIAYMAASFPLIMILRARNVGFLEIINDEFFAEEITRTLVGSIGLIMVVPIASLLASYFVVRRKNNLKHHPID